MSDSLHHIRFVHEPVHERLLNWAKWLRSSGRGPGTSPMFRGYRAPKYRNSAEEAYIPTDPLDAVVVEKAVYQLPEKHRDACRWWYCYSAAGIGVWQACRALGVGKDTLAQLVHDSRSMLKNRLDKPKVDCIMPPIPADSASAVPASRREAGATAEETN